MPENQNRRSGSRSDQRIPKLRTRGRANRDRLLAEAQRLIEERAGKTIRFSEVFEAAGVSRGSAYRIYNGIEDLMQDLSSTWINNFVAFVRHTNLGSNYESWTDLSDALVARSAEYWFETEQTLRVLPRVRTNAPDSYRQAVKDLTQAFTEVYDRSFQLPEIPDWFSVMGMYVQLGDTIFADAVRRDGRITAQRLSEAQTICRTYLALYLPTWLPAKKQHS